MRPGTGKSSLIRAILQCCEHIVHVGQTKDALVGGNLPNYPRFSHTEGPRITEVYASTMPRPPWWTPCEDDISEPCQDYELGTQYDKNICFVDTPGHGADTNVCFEVLSSLFLWLLTLFGSHLIASHSFEII